MRRLSLVLALAVLSLLGAAQAVQAAAPSAFAGEWTAIDKATAASSPDGIGYRRASVR